MIVNTYTTTATNPNLTSSVRPMGPTGGGGRGERRRGSRGKGDGK